MNPKILSIFLAIAACGAVQFSGRAAPENLSSFLRQEAETYLEAYQAKDYEACLQMMGEI